MLRVYGTFWFKCFANIKTIRGEKGSINCCVADWSLEGLRLRRVATLASVTVPAMILHCALSAKRRGLCDAKTWSTKSTTNTQRTQGTNPRKVNVLFLAEHVKS
jgi:hypothetical protein